MSKPSRRSAALLCTLAALWAGGVAAQVSVTTYHNDNSRTGQNLQETTLTPANVNSTQFGRLFTVTVDGSVYAQPLYLPNVFIAGATHNVLYVATQHDSVYAIDADTGTQYWHVSLIPAGGSTVNPNVDLAYCGDIPTEIGITGTPVIDPTTNTLYVVAKSKLNGVISQYLHALDVGGGTEKFGGPVAVSASVPGTAGDGSGGVVTFNARQQNQRAALLLENGHVVIAWSSHCDTNPWHGWLMSYNAGTLTQEAVYNSTPNGSNGGIWLGASGPAADASGNLYVSTGNGNFDAADKGSSIVKLGPPSGSSLPLLDYFTPYNQGSLTSADLDISSGGLMLLPPLPSGQQFLVTIGKAGTLYLADTSNLGKYCSSCTSVDTNVHQEIQGVFTGFWGAPAYWNGNLYWSGGNDDTNAAEPLKAFAFNAGTGLVSAAPTSMSARSFNFSGPIPSISSNGTTNGILWGVDNGNYATTCSGGTGCQVLYAYDATNLANLLYTSSQAANNRDVPGAAVKFATPTVANGKVYVGSVGAVSAFGELAGIPPIATVPSFTPAGGIFSTAQSVALADPTPGASIYYTLDGSTPTTASARYTAPLPINATTTVNALATAASYSNSPVSSATYVIVPAGSVMTQVSLGAGVDVTGIGNNGSPVPNGGLDGGGYAYSSALLGSSVIWSGVAFNIGAGGSPDAMSGGTLALPAGNYNTLNILATAVRGNQTNQTFVVTYTDGTTTTITQSLSDWYTPQNYSGESKALSMAYRLNSSGGLDNRTFNLYGYSFSINPLKTVQSVSFPSNRNVVVLAATLTATPLVTGATPVSLAPVASVDALGIDGSAVPGGGIDGHSNAYSGTLLGTSAAWSGVTFTLGAPAVADAVTQKTLTLPGGNFSKLNLLATAVNGNTTGQTFTITYTDNTTTVITQSLSDWFTPQSYAGESKAVVMPYRLTATGAKDARTFNLYGYAFAINNTKIVKSVTFPNNAHIVVLAVTLTP